MSALPPLEQQAAFERFRTLVHGKSNDLVPFLGAGVSIPLRYPGWTDFLCAQAHTLGVDIDPLLNQMRYEEAANALYERDRERLEYGIDQAYNRPPMAITRETAVFWLAKLFTGPVLTTNYDPVCERAFESTWRLDNLSDEGMWDAVHTWRRAVIHLHGRASERRTMILAQSEYLRHYGPRKPLRNALIQLTSRRPLVFVGCSMGRPNGAPGRRLVVDRYLKVIGQGRAALSGKQRCLMEHYAFLPWPESEEVADGWGAQLRRLGISALWYSARDDHRALLEALCHLAGGKLPPRGTLDPAAGWRELVPGPDGRLDILEAMGLPPMLEGAKLGTERGPEGLFVVARPPLVPVEQRHRMGRKITYGRVPVPCGGGPHEGVFSYYGMGSSSEPVLELDLRAERIRSRETRPAVAAQEPRDVLVPRPQTRTPRT